MDFNKPQVVPDVLYAFPGDVEHLMPAMADISKDFQEGTGEAAIYAKFFSKWFFSGLERHPEAKPDIDLAVAMRHLVCVVRSFQPKHEHKEAACAYLISLWLTKDSVAREVS